MEDGETCFIVSGFWVEEMRVAPTWNEKASYKREIGREVEMPEQQY